ncbi:Hypothetical predicted protein [Podarcis lilfordi]|uniref:C-type lectin domain-containing protein n=1 Tax=Podarcis lilfordi TaxID=74358 RepID=A0AA35KC05_9SAUR|nr:Hypothetical predicted protein [Podarcis lilfordi]
METLFSVNLHPEHQISQNSLKDASVSSIQCSSSGNIFDQLTSNPRRRFEQKSTLHKARSFGSGSERLYTTNLGEGDFETLSATCLAAGGHVPSPKKEAENNALQSVLKRHEKSAYVTGHNFDAYTNWAFGEPSNSDGSKNCTKAAKDGKWHSTSCEEKLLTVCEFSFIP